MKESEAEELERWSQAWRAFEEEPVDWLIKRSQAAHRQEAALHAVYWGLLGVGVLAVVGAVSFGAAGAAGAGLRLSVAVAALGVGVAWMSFATAQVRRARTLLTSTPAGLVADLRRVRERELRDWTSAKSLGTTAAVALAAGVVIIRDVLDALANGESAPRPVAGLVILVGALIVLAVVGRVRVRRLRGELDRIGRLEGELRRG